MSAVCLLPTTITRKKRKQQQQRQEGRSRRRSKSKKTMDVEEDDSVPMCTVCNHRHVQGVKCHICGHVGRSQIYQKMKAKAILKRATKTLFYDGTNFEHAVDDWDVIFELRKRTYCADNDIPVDQEFSELLEKASRHVICYIGDSPTAVARYRIFDASEGMLAIEIDRLAVLSTYRGRGFARRMIQDILGDAQAVTNNAVGAITISIPLAVPWIKSKLESLGWRHYDRRPADVRGASTYIHMIFYAQSAGR